MTRLLTVLSLTAWMATAAGPSALGWQAGPQGCTPRFAHTVTWAPALGSYLVFAGEHAEGGGFVFYNDAWQYTPGTAKPWAQVAVEGAKPPIRGYHGAVWDDGTQALWIYGGTEIGFHPKGDLWRLDFRARKWASIKPRGPLPPARVNPFLFHDAAKKRLVMLAGIGKFAPGHNLGDLWFFDLKKQTWRSSKAKWPGRWQCAAAFDPKSGTVFVHGGFDDRFVATDQTWLLDTRKEKWREVGKGFAVTDAHAAVWHAPSKRFLVYGGALGNIAGTDIKNGLARLASFDPKKRKWRDLELAEETGPGPRGYHGLAASPAGQLLLFGGTRNQFNSPEHEAVPWLLRLAR